MRALGVRRVYYTTGDILNNNNAWRMEKLVDIENDSITIADRRCFDILKG